MHTHMHAHKTTRNYTRINIATKKDMSIKAQRHTHARMLTFDTHTHRHTNTNKRLSILINHAY